MVAEQFTDLQKAVGPEITKTDLVPAFQVHLFYIYYACVWFTVSENRLKTDLIIFANIFNQVQRNIFLLLSKLTKKLQIPG